MVRDGPAHAIQRRFVHLIESCWDAKPSSRPNIQQVTTVICEYDKRVQPKTENLGRIVALTLLVSLSV